MRVEHWPILRVEMRKGRWMGTSSEGLGGDVALTLRMEVFGEGLILRAGRSAVCQGIAT